MSVAQVAAIVLTFVAHSACRSDGVPSADGCSLISVNAAAGVTTAALLLTPKTPYAALSGSLKGDKETVRPLTASPLFTPVCPMAPAPFTPLVSTPSHWDTIH